MWKNSNENTRTTLLLQCKDQRLQGIRTAGFTEPFTCYLKTRWPLTYANIEQFIVLEVIFGICHALSGSAITTSQSPDFLRVRELLA